MGHLALKARLLARRAEMVEKAAARQTSVDGSEAGEEIGAISLSETSDEDMAAFAADARMQVARLAPVVHESP